MVHTLELTEDGKLADGEAGLDVWVGGGKVREYVVSAPCECFSLKKWILCQSASHWLQLSGATFAYSFLIVH